MTTHASPAIEVNGLTKRYGDVVALDDLSFSVERGTVFGFLGPNGSGKTTTIYALLDFVRPTDGRRRVLGLDVTERVDEVRRRTGIVPEGAAVYDRLTGREHVAFAIESLDADDDPAAVLDRVGLTDAIDRPVRSYSKGMTKRLMLAMALVGSPDLLILDEPAAGLDPGGIRRVREIVREEAARGATVFFSSHSLDQVEAVCDRVAILNQGSLVAEDSPEGLRTSVGGDTTLHVEVDHLPDGAVETVRGLAGVTDVAVDGTSVTVACADDVRTRVLRELEDAGARLGAFESEPASFEEAFLAYTGGERR